MSTLSNPNAAPDTWMRAPSRVPRGGLRSGALFGRHVTARNGRHALDAVVMDMERPRGVEIAGQVTWTEHVHVPAADVELVLLGADGGVRARTRSNAFGEFQFPRRPGEHLALHVPEEGEGRPPVLVWEAAS